jgi:hypothetical protein
MNKLESNWSNISQKANIIDIYIDEIVEIVRQLRDWEDIKTCKCSYYPLREIVEMAIKWEIWEKYRSLLYFDNDHLVKKLAQMINNRQYN